MSDDLVKDLRFWNGGIDSDKKMQKAADRIEQLEAALRQCEIIAEQYQKENEWRAEITNGTTTKAKARAVAARCGMLLGSQRKVIRKALEGKDG
jgi:hypothetical protein